MIEKIIKNNVIKYFSGITLMLLWICFCAVLCKAQGLSDPANFQVKVSPPAPEASRFILYGQYNLGNTGRPQISIPIFNAGTPGLPAPVSLDYEGTGCIADELASWVGSGWLLNTGGVITRVVMGLPDENYNGYLNTTLYNYADLINDNNDTYLDYKYNVANNRIDSEPDMYYYNFNGHSGQFTYDAQKNIFQIIPQTPLKITRIANNIFQIVDETGKIYTFGGLESSDSEGGVSQTIQPNCVTSWWLTSIKNPEKTDEVTFEYQQDIQSEMEVKNAFSATYGPPVYCKTLTVSSGNSLEQYQSEIHREWYPLRLTRINFKNGKVEFNRVADRLDWSSSRLDNIMVYNQTGGNYNLLKKIKFVMGYFQYTGQVSSSIFYANTSGRYRLKLNSLEEYDGQNNLIAKHSFDYNMDVTPPFRGSFAQDYWGYYNGAGNNDNLHTLMPSQTTWDQAITFGGAVRESNEAAMKAGVIKSITYPTGGSTVFNWEANKYQFSQTTTNTEHAYCSAYGNNTYNSPHPSQTVTFVPPINDDQATLTIEIANVDRSGLPNYENPDYQDLEDESFPSVSLKNVTTGEVVYSGTNASYTNNTLSYSVNCHLVGGNTYELRSDCYRNSVNAYANITANYHTITNTTDVRLAGGLRIASIENHEKDGTLVSKENYKYGNNESGYGNLSSMADQLYNFTNYRLYQYDSASGCGGQDESHYECKVTGSNRTVYSSSSVYGLGLSSGSSVIYPSITKYKVNGSSDIGKSIFYYGNLGASIPFPLPDGAEAKIYPIAYQWMPGVLIKQEDFKNTGTGYQMIRQVVNTYSVLRYTSITFNKIGWNRDMSHAGCYYTSGHFYVSNIRFDPGNYKLMSTVTRQLDGATPVETTTTYAYDNVYYNFPVTQTMTNSTGNVLKTNSKYVFNKNDISNLTTNASAAIDKLIANNIVAPVIEAESYNNNNFLERRRTDYKIWSASSADMIKPEFIQLQKSTAPVEPRYNFKQYDNFGNLLQQAAVSGPSTCYLWSYNNQYPVAEIKNADFDMLKNLLGGAAAIDNFSNSSPTDVQLNNFLAPLRTGLNGALVTTYTYTPLVGMTSSTDPKGQTTYYEYDSFQRLMNVKDQYGHILKHYCYNYAGQATGCDICLPAWQNTTTAIRCKVNASNQNTGEQEQEQRDITPCSPTYNQTRWVVTATNTTACPIPVICTNDNCSGPDKKCINGNCETGQKVYTNSVQIHGSLWTCTFHYAWSDGSVSGNYTETQSATCMNVEY